MSGMKMFDVDAVEKIWAMQGQIRDVLLAVKYDDEIGGYYLEYMGGVKIAMKGDPVPIHALTVAIANEGKWIPVGAGN